MEVIKLKNSRDIKFDLSFQVFGKTSLKETFVKCDKHEAKYKVINNYKSLDNERSQSTDYFTVLQ